MYKYPIWIVHTTDDIFLKCFFLNWHFDPNDFIAVGPRTIFWIQCTVPNVSIPFKEHLGYNMPLGKLLLQTITPGDKISGTKCLEEINLGPNCTHTLRVDTFFFVRVLWCKNILGPTSHSTTNYIHLSWCQISHGTNKKNFSHSLVYEYTGIFIYSHL